MSKKEPYVKPVIEVTEFLTEDSIAFSGVGAGLFEEIWNFGDSDGE